MKLQDILQAIANGELDSSKDVIHDAFRAREEMLATTLNFDQHVDSWFDALTDWATNHREDAQTLLQIASKRATRKNVLAFYDLVKATCRPYMPRPEPAELRDFAGLVLLGVHCVEVLNREFRKEFRFAFGEITKAESLRCHWRKVSAASELFSLTRQAITY